MTLERFEILAEAFGGDVSRWPANERDAAAALMSAEPGRIQAVLARAGELDAALAAYAPPRGSAELTERTVLGAPNVRPGRWIGWLLPVGMGAGLAAACAAGVMAGLQLSAGPVQATDGDALVSVIGDDDFGFEMEDAAG